MDAIEKILGATQIDARYFKNLKGLRNNFLNSSRFLSNDAHNQGEDSNLI